MKARKYEHETSKGVDLGTKVWIWCPGCDAFHALIIRSTPALDALVSSGKAPIWGWNGNLESPTFTPSYLVQSEAGICHSYITDGHIQFLSDCTHHLTGQTVELPDLKDNEP